MEPFEAIAPGGVPVPLVRMGKAIAFGADLSSS